ncbi:MAG: ComEC/Rec2 family competence protein [Vampirovibrionales bacterium]|nr:ComEC/Rec2 family competence protein [Vampirovibrionales bacterium]
MTLLPASTSTSQTPRFFGYQQLSVLGLWALAFGLAMGSQGLSTLFLTFGLLVGVSLGFIVFIALGWILWHSNKRWVLLGAVACVAFILGLAIGAWRCTEVNPQSITRWGPVYQARVEALVANSQPLGASPNTGSMAGNPPHRVTFELLGVNGYRVDGVARVWRTSMLLPPVGARVMLVADVVLPAKALFSGDFDEAQVLRAEGVDRVIRKITSAETIEDTPATPYYQLLRWVDGLQGRITESFGHWLPKNEADVLAGMVLGNRVAPLDGDIRQQFAETGLIHLLAASGFNVGMVAGAVWWLGGLLMARFRVGRGWLSPLVMVMVVLYVLLAGASPSVLRAGAMLLVGVLVPSFSRLLGFKKIHWPPLVLLLMAINALLLWQPMLAYHLGFQLSVAATVGLMTMVPPLHAWLSERITGSLAGLMVVPLVAQLWVTPLLINTFHQVAWHSVVLNILALVCVTPLTVGGFGAALLATVWPWGGSAIAWLLKPFATVLLWLVDWGAHWQLFGHKGFLAVTAPPEGWVLLAYISLSLLACMLMRLDAPSDGLPLLGSQRQLRFKVASWMLVCLAAVWVIPSAWDYTHASLQVFPLSQEQAAFVVKPPNTFAVAVVAPQAAGFWEARRLERALTHHVGLSHVSQVFAYGPPRAQAQKQSPLDRLQRQQHWRSFITVDEHVTQWQGFTIEPTGERDEDSPNLSIAYQGKPLLLGTRHYERTHEAPLNYWSRAFRPFRVL